MRLVYKEGPAWSQEVPEKEPALRGLTRTPALATCPDTPCPLLRTASFGPIPSPPTGGSPHAPSAETPLVSRHPGPTSQPWALQGTRQLTMVQSTSSLQGQPEPL